MSTRCELHPDRERRARRARSAIGRDPARRSGPDVGTLPSRRRPRRVRSPSALRAGFTLVEILIVLSLMAILLGIGVGVFARIDFSQRIAASVVHDVLRSAHNWSVARGAPALVRVDAAANKIRAQGFTVVGTWRFEDETLDGAFELGGAKFGGKLVDDGFQGRAISFAGEPSRSRVEFAVQRDPSFDLGRGFAIALRVRPVAARGGALLRFGDSVAIDTGDDGAVRAWMRAEQRAEDGHTSPGAQVSVATDAGALAPERWTDLELSYDGQRLALVVDGVLRGAVDEDAPVWRADGPLVLSPAAEPYPGAVDDLRVSVVGADDEAELPRNASFDATGPKEIHFAAGGELDRAVHREPVRLPIDFEDGRREWVTVSLYGTVQ